MSALETLRARLAEIKQQEQAIAPAPWDPDCFSGAIRHLNKNVDHDAYCMNQEEHDGGPGRYDGNNLAHLRNVLPRLVEVVEEFMKEHPPCYCHELTEDLCMVCRLFQRCSEILGREEK